MMLVLGCSHTTGIKGKSKSWTDFYDGPLDMVNLSSRGSGFYHLVYEAKRLVDKKPTILILQKPSPYRYPWFCSKNRRWHCEKSYTTYFSLPISMRRRIMNDVHTEEKRLLIDLDEMFPTLEHRAIWTHWSDWYITNHSTSDEIASGYIQKFHEDARNLGFHDFETIIKPSVIKPPNVSEFGDDWWLFMQEQEWVLGTNDPHSPTKRNEEIYLAINQWLKSIEADVAKRQTR